MLTCKTYFNWSSGKDSALALQRLLQNPLYSVEYLLTTIHKPYQRVTMHGVRVELLLKQWESIGIAGGMIELPENPTNADYETLMVQKIIQLKHAGFQCAAFGDIFLEDLRQYRERLLQAVNISAVFPIWQKNSQRLADELIDGGFKAIVVCINADLMDKSFVGRVFDRDFVNNLPQGIDPCGENGEFHTFCFDAPFFKHPVEFSVGETVLKEYRNSKTRSQFWFCDLLPL